MYPIYLQVNLTCIGAMGQHAVDVAAAVTYTIFCSDSHFLFVQMSPSENSTVLNRCKLSSINESNRECSFK